MVTAIPTQVEPDLTAPGIPCGWPLGCTRHARPRTKPTGGDPKYCEERDRPGAPVHNTRNASNLTKRSVTVQYPQSVAAPEGVTGAPSAQAAPGNAALLALARGLITQATATFADLERNFAELSDPEAVEQRVHLLTTTHAAAVANLDLQLAQANSRAAELERTLAEANEQLRDKDAQLEAATEAQGLERAAHAATRELLQCIVDSDTDSRDRLADQLDLAREQHITAMAALHHEAEQNRQAAEDREEALTQELRDQEQAHQARLAAVQADQEALAAAHTQLQRDHATAQQEIEAKSADLESEREQRRLDAQTIERLEQDLEAATTKAGTLADEVTDMGRRFITQAETFAAALAEANRRVETLTEERTTAENKAARFEVELDALRARKTPVATPASPEPDEQHMTG